MELKKVEIAVLHALTSACHSRSESRIFQNPASIDDIEQRWMFTCLDLGFRDLLFGPDEEHINRGEIRHIIRSTVVDLVDRGLIDEPVEVYHTNPNGVYPSWVTGEYDEQWEKLASSAVDRDVRYTPHWIPEIGERVVKNPEKWRSSEYDAWGSGDGVGVVVPFEFQSAGVPFDQDGNPYVDVRWPKGRSMSYCSELLPENGIKT